MGLFRNESKLIVGTSKGRMYTFNWDQFGLHSNMFPGKYHISSNQLIFIYYHQQRSKVTHEPHATDNRTYSHCWR